MARSRLRVGGGVCGAARFQGAQARPAGRVFGGVRSRFCGQKTASIWSRASSCGLRSMDVMSYQAKPRSCMNRRTSSTSGIPMKGNVTHEDALAVWRP